MVLTTQPRPARTRADRGMASSMLIKRVSSSTSRRRSPGWRALSANTRRADDGAPREEILRPERRRAARPGHADSARQGAAGEIPLHPVRGQARGRTGLERQDARRMHDGAAVSNSGAYRRAPRRNQDAGRPVRQSRPATAGLDQQADLGRQQADPVIAEGGRVAPANRGRGRL